VKTESATLEKLLSTLKAYSPQADESLLLRAFQFAEKAHTGQTRASGEDYITHPLEVAMILTETHMDIETLVAAVLHDVVEDTQITIKEIRDEFGDNVARLVDGVTKLSRLDFKNKQEQQAESLRKMLLAMAEDVRVILIKLADRLHNMRTLTYRPLIKRKATARETLDIYAPLAHRLGISRMQWEMEDLAFRHLEPEAYRDIAERVAAKRIDREKAIAAAIAALQHQLAEVEIKGEISGRPKHFYSIFRKMQAGRSFEDIFDLIAIRVIVDSVKDCYGVLGLAHNEWRPIPGRFKDYIAMPKPNFYQSLHTTVVGERGEPLEIQIRTWEMHRIAEYGVAAHWAYKDGVRPEKSSTNKLTWLRSILEWQQDLRDPEEFVDGLRMDLFSDEVFVFTPKGDIVDLPVGSIPIDFAYRVHTDVGHRCVGAKVNGRIVPLNYVLKNGDIVEIITTKQPNGPSRDWVKMVRTSQARSRIRQWFKKEQKEENIEKGREALEREIKRLGHPVDEVLKDKYLEEVADGLNCLSDEDLLAGVGHGDHSAVSVTNKLLALYIKERGPLDSELLSLTPPDKPPASAQHLKVSGLDGALVKLARCCNPLPGDEIIGFITRGKGVSVHTTNCPNMPSLMQERERLIEVSWGDAKEAQYPVRIELVGMDRPGLLQDVVHVLGELKVNISNLQARANREKEAIVTFTLVVKDLGHLDRVLQRLQKIRDLYVVKRISSAGGKGEDSVASSGTTGK
jgi:GTP pyrophosphokinase